MKFAAIVAISLNFGISNISSSFADDKKPVVTDNKEQTMPIVAIVKADWSPGCKKIDPTVKGVMNEFFSLKFT